jgi:hypothetical protein
MLSSKFVTLAAFLIAMVGLSIESTMSTLTSSQGATLAAWKCFVEIVMMDGT